jgi:hypothetical protein
VREASVKVALMGKNCFVQRDVVRSPNSLMVAVVSGVYSMVVLLCRKMSKARQNVIMAAVYDHRADYS